MAKAAAVYAVFLLLALVFATGTAELPPDDLDGSGDDEDFFSGSGLGFLPEEKPVFLNNTERGGEADVKEASTSVATESQQPIAQEPKSTEEKETGTVPATTAVETEKLLPGPDEVHDTNLSEETATEASTPGFLAPELQPAAVTSQASSTVIVPVVHHIPEPAPSTTSVTQAIDPLVNLGPQETTSATQTIDPHHHHHHHHHHHPHHHHEAKTSVASVTETIEPHVHHVNHHPEATSATHAMDPHKHHSNQETTVTHGMDPHKHHSNQETTATHGMDPHKHHENQGTSATSTTNAIVPHVHVHDHPHDKNNATESIVPDLTTSYLHMSDGDAIVPTTAIDIASHGDNKVNFTVIPPKDESELEHPNSKDEEGSGDNSLGDFEFEGPITNNHVPESNEEPIQRDGVPRSNEVLAAEDHGVSDTSKGLMEQKGVLAAVIAGGVAGLVFAVGLVGFMLYRMKKKDEGSYSLEEPKQTNGGYQKPLKQEEFYA